MPSRSRRKPLPVLATALVMGVVGLWLWIGKTNERKEFVGNIDPASGYRCRFTISPSWKRKNRDFGMEPWSLTEYDSFIVPPSPIRQWVDSKLIYPVNFGQWIC
ncbi:MAG: hypothetical protein JWL77_1418 [Chthonomonadaceae bacterium]|nr:hypothetical protein [Chthonomonadaceae bacterium]